MCLTPLKRYSQTRMDWHVYIVECADGTLYTGITTNLERRIVEHNSGRGARYTSGRGPVRLVYSQSAANRSEAGAREVHIKRLKRKDKIHLIGAMSDCHSISTISSSK